MWPTVMVYIIAIAAGIAIILPVADDRANHATDDTAYRRASSGANAWKD